MLFRKKEKKERTRKKKRKGILTRKAGEGEQERITEKNNPEPHL